MKVQLPTKGTEIELKEVITQKIFEEYQEILFPNGDVNVNMINTNKSVRFLVRTLAGLSDSEIDAMPRRDFVVLEQKCLEILKGDEEKKSE